MPGKSKYKGNRKRKTRASGDGDESSELQVICKNQGDKKFIPSFTASAKRLKRNQKEEKQEEKFETENEEETPKMKTDVPEPSESKTDYSPHHNAKEEIESVVDDTTSINLQEAGQEDESTKKNGQDEVSDAHKKLLNKQKEDINSTAAISSQAVDSTQNETHDTANSDDPKDEDASAKEKRVEQQEDSPVPAIDHASTLYHESADNQTKNQIVPDTVSIKNAVECEEPIDDINPSEVSRVAENEDKKTEVKEGVNSNATMVSNSIREQEIAQGVTEMKDLFGKLNDVRNVISKAKGDLQIAINYQKTHGL